MTRSVLGLAGIAVAAALGVDVLQPTMAASFRAVKARDDVYMLPPPEQLKASTLGYRSAVADMLWATLLVEYGRHWADKRSFPDLEKYIDAILALEPGYANLYRFVDTLLVFRPIRGTEDDARKARAYLERGLRERPADKDVWMRYGQFVGFLAPSFLSSEQERQQWRLDGSEALVRAMELGGNIDRALSASSLLSRSGRRSAALDYLERAHALTDDPATLAEIEARLERLQRESVDTAESAAQRALRQRRDARTRFVDGRWRAELPFISRGEFLLVGPFASSPFACSGASRLQVPECARHWRAALDLAVR